MWSKFNMVADNWGVSSSQFARIVSELADELNLGGGELDPLARAIFALFDTDNNDVVDALEFLAAFALTSCMTDAEKLAFAFNLYDFDESGLLSRDEMTLSLKSTVTGLCKMAGLSPPSLVLFENVARLAFEQLSGGAGPDAKISQADFVAYCSRNPAVVSWLAFFTDAATPPPVPERLAGDSDLEEEGAIAERPAALDVINCGDPEDVFAVEDEGEGDEFMAVKPWLGAIAEPSDPPAEVPAAPDAALELEWVYGYRAQDSRNNLRYTGAGDIVYPAASLGVVYTPVDKSHTGKATQRFNRDHVDDVRCLAVSPDGSKVATGELGKRPRIVVWDAQTCTALSVIQGFHRRAVTHLDFSPCGELLVSVGGDDNHSVAVYKWATRSKLFSGKSSTDKVLDCRFAGDSSRFVTAGVNHVYFWDRAEGSRRWRMKKGIFGSKGKLQAILAVCPLGDGTTVVTGGVSGQLYVWEGRNCRRAVKAHSKAITSLYRHAARGVIVSGCKDGSVRLWNEADLSGLGSFSLENVEGCAVPRVRSVCLSDDGARVLVGTRGSEIFELASGLPSVTAAPAPALDDDADEEEVAAAAAAAAAAPPVEGPPAGEAGADLHAGALVVGHCRDELWGVAAHPAGKAECVTVGDDKTIRVWDLASHALLRQAELPSMARAVAYSPDGKFLAVGLGGRVGRGRQRDDGGFLVLNEGDLSTVHEGKCSDEWVSDIKFSPDGSTLAVGTHDNCIYLLNAANDYRQLHRLAGHNSYITHFDFSSDSQYIQSTCGAYELLFWEVATGEQEPSASNLKDTEWATQTCTLGWPVQGIWPPFADGTDINSVDLLKKHELLATADDFGKVKLFRYPSLNKGHDHVVSSGHSSHVTNVRFAAGGNAVVSTGGNDRCLFQWALDLDSAVDSGGEDGGAGGEGADDEAKADGAGGEDGADEAKTAADEAKGEDGDKAASSDEEDLLRDGAALDRPAAFEAHRGDDAADLFALEDAAAGDEFMAVKPWVGAIVEPSNAPPAPTRVPDSDLELEWVHGYRAQDARNNLVYSASGRIVYPAAATGVSLDKAAWTQTFNHEHTDDVVSLALHPDGVHVATGEMGRRPAVVVWNAETGATAGRVKCGRIRAACQVAFSPSGRLLAVAGQDDQHTVAVYDWVSGDRVARAKSGSNKILALAFASETTLFSAGVKHYKVWTLNGRDMRGKKGLFGSQAKVQPLLSLAHFQGQMIMGAADGRLYSVPDGERKIANAWDAHGGRVNALTAAHGLLVSGGRDGVVKVWNDELGVQAEFSVDVLGTSLKPAVRAVYPSADGTRVLVGTRGSEVYEVCCVPVPEGEEEEDEPESEEDEAEAGSGAEDGDDGDAAAAAPKKPKAPKRGVGSDVNGGPLVRGHCKDELWGLAVHPAGGMVCTVGDDKTVRVWDTAAKKLKAQLTLDCMARAVAYSPDGDTLVVGLGGSVGRGKQRKDGGFVVVDASQLAPPADGAEAPKKPQLVVAHEGRDSKQWISDVKFSPNGNFVALGSHDNVIYLYNTNSWSLVNKLTKHNSYITHFDWSVDSSQIQSTCGAYELLFYEAASGNHIGDPDETKDTQWVSQTCTLGWPVQGIWPPCADGTDVNAVDRSACGTTLATADDFGKVKLFQWPCVTPGAPCTDYDGHSSHVTNVRFSADNELLFSTGGNDRCLFQWRHVRDEAANDSAGEAGDSGNDSDVGCFGALDAMAAEAGGEDGGGIPGFELEEADAGDEFGAVKPWVGAIVEPSQPPEENPAAPDGALRLEHVHGYRSRDARSNAHYNEEGEIVYPAAGLGIMYNKPDDSQRFYRGHGDDVLSLAVSPCGRFVATGEIGKRPRVHIWDACTGAQLCELPRFHKRGIPVVAWSPCSTMVASTGQDNNHSLAVWESASGEWTDGRKKSTSKCSSEKVLFAHFTGEGVDDFQLVTGGVKHVLFWRLGLGRNIQSKKGLFGSLGKIQPVLSAATVGGRVVTGTVSGHLYVWAERKVAAVVKAHAGPVASLSGVGGTLVSGGKDGVASVWNADLSPRMSVNVAELSPPPYQAAVRSVSLDADATKFLVGTRGAEVYEVVADSGSALLIAEGHCQDELWGLAPHPTDPDLYATCGDDKSVRVWSVAQKKVVKRAFIDTMARAVCWSPDGRFLAVGLGGRVGRGRQRKDGFYLVVDAETMQTVVEQRVSEEWISDIKYAPNGETLAIGSHDNRIYLLDVNDNYVLRATCESHNSYITHLDWTADSTALRSTCGAYELLFHLAVDGSQEPSAEELKDKEWASETCTLGWAVQGIWPEFADGTDINAVDRSPDGALLATADDFGKVNVYRYPCVTRGNAKLEGAGHCSHVTNVRFAADGTHMFTAGGNDRAVFQWAL